MDGDRIAVGGESAGGNLAAALCIWARDNDAPRISHQAIIYPFTDATLSALDWDSSVMPGVDRSAGEHAANPLFTSCTPSFADCRRLSWSRASMTPCGRMASSSPRP